MNGFQKVIQNLCTEQIRNEFRLKRSFIVMIKQCWVDEPKDVRFLFVKIEPILLTCSEAIDGKGS